MHQGLRDGISAARLESADLEAQQQHLKRTAANLKDRIRKLESQVGWRMYTAMQACTDCSAAHENVEFCCSHAVAKLPRCSRMLLQHGLEL